MHKVDADLTELEERVKDARELVDRGDESEEVRAAIAAAMRALDPVARIKLGEYREATRVAIAEWKEAAHKSCSGDG